MEMAYFGLDYNTAAWASTTILSWPDFGQHFQKQSTSDKVSPWIYPFTLMQSDSWMLCPQRCLARNGGICFAENSVGPRSPPAVQQR